MIFLYILILIVGFVGLVKGADLFVDGSAKIATIALPIPKSSRYLTVFAKSVIVE